MANTAPSLNNAASPVLTSIAQGATNPAGITVASLIVDGSITDIDGAVESIAITALNTSLGAWQYSTDNGTIWLTIRADLINSTTNELALLLSSTDKIRLLPFGNLNGTLSDAITFRAWDETSGAHGDYVAIAATGNSTAFSDASDTASLTVTANNSTPTFTVPTAGTGKLIIPIGSGDDYSKNVAILSDGKILLVGQSLNGIYTDFSLVRLNTDGSLDPSFDVDGKALASAGVSITTALKFVVQEDGKILLLGNYYDSFAGRDYPRLVRLNADGSLDTSFDVDGKVSIPWPGQISGVETQTDGKILLAGVHYGGVNNEFSLIRLNSDGSFDTTFDPDGQIDIPVGISQDYGQSVTVQSDGKILVAGYSDVAGTSHFSLVRLNTNGSLDTSFDVDGTMIVPLGSGASNGRSVVVQNDGKIVLAGIYYNGSNFDFALIRLNSDGSKDTSFSTDGEIIVPVGSNHDYSYNVALQPDGKILLVGQSYNNSAYGYSLIRLNTDGTLDTTFDTDGKAILANGNYGSYGFDITVQSDSKIVLTGASYNGSNWDFGVLRLRTDGSLDTTFGATAGSNTLGGTVSYTENAAAIALDSAVAIYDADLAALNSGNGDYAGASVSLARNGGANADDVLAFNTSGALFTVSGGNLQSGGQTFATFTSTGGTLTVNFTSSATTATQALVNDVLSHITYLNSADAPPASVQIDWTFSDGNSGSQGSGGALTAAGSTTVNITASVAPSLDNSASPTLGSVLEGATDPSGVTVASLVVDGSITDADGVHESIAITALNTSLGAWQYSTDGGTTWLTIRADLINSTTNELALLLSSTDKIRLLPFGNLNGTLNDAITFRAWDESRGVHGDYVEITATGGSAAFSTASDTASLTVTANNSTPTFVVPTAGTGKVITDIGSSSGDQGRSVTVQSDGKIIVVGSSSNGSNADFSVVRLKADGSLDTDFASGGKAIIPMGSGDDYGARVTLQSDGKILVAIQSYNNNNYDFSVVRFDRNGNLDQDFGISGVSLIATDNGSNVVYSIAVQNDGKIILAGESNGLGGADFSILRLNPNGSLDTTFNSAGKALIPVGNSNDYGRSVTLQSDGKILMGGYSTNGAQYDFSVLRLNANGSLDDGFGSSGKTLIPIGDTTADIANSMTVQSDGKILVAGTSFNGSTYEFSIVRLCIDGSLDDTFGSGGKALIPVGSDDTALDIALQNDGMIVVAGQTFNGSNYDFSVVRLNVNGTLDTNFNGTGKAVIPIGLGYDSGQSVTIQNDGKILVAGTSYHGSSYDFAVIRLNPDGTLDTTFGATTGSNTLGGTVSYTENAAAIALDSSVAIYDADLAALNSGNGNYAGASVSLARNGGASAQDELAFNTSGALFTVSGGNLQSGGLTFATFTSTGGTLTINFTSSATTATQALVNDVLSHITYLNNADSPPSSVQIDWTFSDGNSGSQGSGGALTALGSTTVNITASVAPVLNASATPSLGSVLEGATNPSGVTVASLVVDGSITDTDGVLESIAITTLNTSLGAWQYSTDGGGTWLTIRADLINSTTNELALLLSSTDKIRLLPFGTLNGTLSDAITFRAWDESRGSHGDYVEITAVGGSKAFSVATDTASLTVTAVNSAPSFAATSGGGGKLISVNGTSSDVGQSVIVQNDGMVLIGGASSDGIHNHFAVVRTNSDGSLDSSFGIGGKVTVNAFAAANFQTSMYLQPDGKILMGGSSFVPSVSDPDYALVRFLADGSLDASFGNSGTLTLSLSNFADYGRSITLQTNGKILISGGTTSGAGELAMMRLNADGTLDMSFGTGGKSVIASDLSLQAAQSTSVQSDGKILIGITGTEGYYDSAMVRLNVDGSLDTSFGTGGKTTVPFVSQINVYNDPYLSGGGDRKTALLSDGKILIAGSNYNGSDFDFAVVRMNSDGTIDNSFGTSGKATIAVGISGDYAQSIVIQSDGKILLSGYSFNGNSTEFIDEGAYGSSYNASNFDFAVVRLNPNGSVDTSFGINGKATIQVGATEDLAYGLTLQSDGKIVLSGHSRAGGTFASGTQQLADFSIIRLNADGSLDTTFGATAGSNTLDATPTYTANGSAVVLDSNVQIADQELSAADNYAGSTLTLARNGGANSQDVFAGSGSLSLSAGDVIVGGTTIGTYTNSAGTLTLNFTSNATQSLVNSALQQISYANSNPAASGNAQINWTFNDGSGTGNASITGNTVVTLIPDSTPPTVASVNSSTANGSYKAGDVIAVTVNFSESVNVIGVPQLSLETGVTDRVINYSSGSGSSTLTFNYTVQAGDTTSDLDYLNVSALALNGGSVKDAAGNDAVLTLASPGAANSLGNNRSLVIDTSAPTVASVSSSNNNGSYKIGDTITVNVNFSEAVTVSNIPQLTLETGSTDRVLNYSTGSGSSTLSFSYVVGAGDTASDLDYLSTSALALNGGTIRDAAGNNAVLTLASPGTSNSLGANKNILVDGIAPSVSSIVTVGNPLSNADTVSYTVTFDQSVTGVDLGDFSLSGIGVGGTVASVSGSGAVYTVVVDSIIGNGELRLNLQSSGTGIFDAVGNAITGGYSAGEAFTLDHVAPALLSAITLSDTALRAGETANVQFRFTEPVVGFTTADLTVPDGAISGLTSSDGGTTWDGLLTPYLSSSSTGNRISLNLTGVSDQAGNAGSGTSLSPSYSVDTTVPLLASPITLSDTSLLVGETATVNFSFVEAVTSFTIADLISPNGSLSNLITGDGGLTWSATFTPSASTTASTNAITLDYTSITDLNGNAGVGSATSVNYAIDNVRPTLASSISLSDTALRVGETSTVTFTFSEAVTNFSTADLTVSNAVLSNLSSSNGGTIWTATLTPNSSNTSSGNVVSLSLAGISDVPGNAGTGSANSASFAVDTVRPTVSSITVADTNLLAGETALVTIVFAEAVTGLAADDFTVANGSLSSFASGDGGITWTATLTPSTNIEDSTNIISLNPAGVADLAGNAGASGSVNSGNYAIETSRPTVNISLSDTAIGPFETSTVTFTFSEIVTGFSNADVVLPTTSPSMGSLSTVSSNDGGRTYTALYTPAMGVIDSSNLIGVNLAGVSDVAGNAGVGVGQSTNFSIDTSNVAPTLGGAVSGLTTTNLLRIQPFTGITVTDPDVDALETATITLDNPLKGSFTANSMALAGFYTNDGGVSYVHDAVSPAAMQAAIRALVFEPNPNRLALNTSETTTFTIAVQDQHGGTAINSATTVITSSVNTAPTNILLSDALVAQSEGANATVGLLSATDSNVGDTHTFTLTAPNAGNDNAKFSIVGNSLKVINPRSMTEKDYYVMVQATDANGLSFTKKLTISLDDDIAPFISSIETLRSPRPTVTTGSFIVKFNENVTGVTLDDFFLSSGSGATAHLSSITALSGNAYRVYIDQIVGTGSLNLNLKTSGTGIADLFGNSLPGAMPPAPPATPVSNEMLVGIQLQQDVFM